ncbi:hypothetical protein DFR29_102514 [Tahibacter aquaticus]|uniref:Uncharacterized protein n=1 Tax=Tahibacter aquaticus TaxID=520092 RepID=A0A4R6Z803_9GAMM|nr:hypothetical protein [Tahibacter aquaticus]TDR47852.1 hypothetical protein DFR29_102514 [Tahibacter aquaticus]
MYEDDLELDDEALNIAAALMSGGMAEEEACRTAADLQQKFYAALEEKGEDAPALMAQTAANVSEALGREVTVDEIVPEEKLNGIVRRARLARREIADDEPVPDRKFLH